MPSLKRFEFEGAVYHTISVTHERRPVFAEDETVAPLLEAMDFIRKSGRAYILAFAVMPDHVHLLLAPRGDATISQVMKSIKNHAATMINRHTSRKGAVWQRSFYDRVIRNERQLQAAIEYIHRNPVAAGLGSRTQRYRYVSSNPEFTTDIGTFLGG